jgi:hypothetical protein
VFQRVFRQSPSSPLNVIPLSTLDDNRSSQSSEISLLNIRDDSVSPSRVAQKHPRRLSVGDSTSTSAISAQLCCPETHNFVRSTCYRVTTTLPSDPTTR